MFFAVCHIFAQSKSNQCFRIASDVNGLGVRGKCIAKKLFKGSSFRKHARVVVVRCISLAVHVGAAEMVMVGDE